MNTKPMRAWRPMTLIEKGSANANSPVTATTTKLKAVRRVMALLFF
jgi:hypothetical protein